MNEPQTLKRGQLVLVDTGYCDSYYIVAVCWVMQDFDLIEQADLFSPCPYEVAPDDHRIDTERFYYFLVNKGFLQEIPCANLNFGAGFKERIGNMSIDYL